MDCSLIAVYGEKTMLSYHISSKLDDMKKNKKTVRRISVVGNWQRQSIISSEEFKESLHL